MDMRLYDAQAALTFLVSQTTLIEPQVYRTQYPDIQYARFVPVDTTAPEWVQTITFFSTDTVGAAQWFHAQAQDVPNADVVRSKFQQGVEMAAIGYQFNIEEINVARLVNTNLQADRALAAKRAYDEFVDRVALRGDSDKGWTGLLNSTTVPSGIVAAGTGGTTWATKTPDEILADVNSSLSGIYLGSNTVEYSDTLLLPLDRMLAIGTRRIDAVNQTTILEWIRRNNVYTLTTGNALTIQGMRGLDTMGAGGTHRALAYRRDPTVVKMHLPMPHRFLPVFQKGPLVFEVPGIFRLGGTEFRRPQSARYMDGI